MSLQVQKALNGRDGTTLAVGVFLAFVFQATLVPIANYFTDMIVGSAPGASDVAASAKDGILVPLVGLVITLLVLEVVLWLMSMVRTSK